MEQLTITSLEIRSIIENSDELFVYALWSREINQAKKELFQHNLISQQLQVKDGALRQEIGRAIYESLVDPDAESARCFNPHHGLRAVQGSLCLELLICFHCGNGKAYINNIQTEEWLVISDSCRKLLDDVISNNKQT